MSTILAKMAVQISGNTASFNKSMADASKNMGKFQKDAQKTESVTNKLGSALTGFAAGIGFAALAKNIFEVTAEFQKLEAVLTNTLGSNSLAKSALNDIKEFAAQTPFGVQELTASFVKLANQGFKPTVVQLRALGDIASSQGKQFDQLTEAIIDAQTGEFERLKEFGIRASKEGDKVTFTFKGVEKQVDFTNESIRNYILSLGEAEGVSGSMAAVSKTLGGQVSNLGDSFDSLFNALGQASSGIISFVLSQLNSAVGYVADILNKANRDVFGDNRSKRVKEEFEAFQKLTKSGQSEAINKIAQEVQYWRNELTLLERAFAVNSETGLTAMQKLEKAAKILNLSIEDTVDIFKKQNFELDATKSNVTETEELFKLFRIEYDKGTEAIKKQTEALNKNKSAKTENAYIAPKGSVSRTGLDDLASSFSNNLPVINEGIAGLEVVNTKLQEIGQTGVEVSGLVANGILGIADALGSAIGGGENFGKALLGQVASFSQQFGGLLIANGIALKAFQTFKNPVAMIAAGAALVAIGGAIRSTISSRPGGGGGSGGGGGYSTAYSSSLSNTQNTMQLSASTVVRGQDLFVVFKNYENNNKNTKVGG